MSPAFTPSLFPTDEPAPPPARPARAPAPAAEVRPAPAPPPSTEGAPLRCPACSPAVPNLMGLTRCACCALPRGKPAHGGRCRGCRDRTGEGGAREPGAAVGDERPVVHPLCCGGCGCVALTDEGRGACWRCGWRRAAGGEGETTDSTGRGRNE